MKKKIRHDRGPVPPLRQLKLRPAHERDWAFTLRDQMTNEAARGEIHEKLGITLGSDSQYSRFCSWQLQQREWDALSDILESDEAALTQHFPNASREQIRDAAIKRSYATAELTGDPKFRLKVIQVDSDEASGRFKGEMDKKKFDQKERALNQQRERDSQQLAQRERALQLEREKFEIEKSELILKAARDEEAQKIATSKLSNAEKIAWVREHYFADVEALKSQGGIQLPK